MHKFPTNSEALFFLPLLLPLNYVVNSRSFGTKGISSFVVAFQHEQSWREETNRFCILYKYIHIVYGALSLVYNWPLPLFVRSFGFPFINFASFRPVSPVATVTSLGKPPLHDKLHATRTGHFRGRLRKKVYIYISWKKADKFRPYLLLVMSQFSLIY